MHDDYLTLSQAAKLVPGRRPGCGVSTETVWRWCMKGVRNGLRLKSVLIGGSRLTTRCWLDDFIEALTQTAEPATDKAPATRTPHQRQSEAERATEELKRLWRRGCDARQTSGTGSG